MRAETCVGPNTRLEVVTEGILTRMIQHDPELSGVGLVILDEFHERSLQADLALALLLDVQQGLREDLKLLIMSATLDNDRLRLLPSAPTICSEGRAFPVEKRFQALAAHQRFDEAVAIAARNCCARSAVRCCCSSRAWGNSAGAGAAGRTGGRRCGALSAVRGAPLSEQRKAILPAAEGQRKVVLATNIAETSLTIEGIRLVVDSARSASPALTPVPA